MDSSSPSSGAHQKGSVTSNGKQVDDISVEDLEEEDTEREMNEEMEEDMLLEGDVLEGSNNKEDSQQGGPSFVPLHADSRRVAAADGETSLKTTSTKQQLEASTRIDLEVGAAEAGAVEASHTAKSDHSNTCLPSPSPALEPLHERALKGLKEQNDELGGEGCGNREVTGLVTPRPTLQPTQAIATLKRSKRREASANEDSLKRAARLVAQKNLETLEGYVLDPAKCRLLSINEKRELVRELSKSPGSALERMKKWTRRDIMEILCVKLVRNIKFSSLSKDRMLDHLFRAVNGKKRPQQKDVGKKSSPDQGASNLQPPSKIQRTNDSPSQLPVRRALTNNAYHCQNPACKVALNAEDKFCGRCSCCICFKYDDNKDPSLWLFCTSDESVERDSCGLSCHLECALKDERSGILQNGQSKKLDGGYYCTHCGKQNDLLGCWKQQLLIAKNAQRLDVLCYRIFLSHKILVSTEKYSVLHSIVDTAMKKLEAEVGPMTDTLDVGDRIVGRLPVGVEVQKLCTCALETLQSMFSSALTADLKTRRSLGRSKDSGDKDGLSETNSPVKTSLHLDSSNLILNNMGNLQHLNADDAQLENGSGSQTESALACRQHNHGSLVPVTENGINEASAKADCHLSETGASKPETEPGNSSNKSPCVKLAAIGNKDERSDASYEYCIKVIRRLECEGHIEAKFRMKFFTWFCLRATPHQRRTVGAFVDNLIDDPVSLAGQLVDTFSDAIYSRRPHPVPPSGFCMELWH